MMWACGGIHQHQAADLFALRALHGLVRLTSIERFSLKGAPLRWTRANRIRSRAGHPTINERSSGEQPLGQKPTSGPTIANLEKNRCTLVPLSALEFRNRIETRHVCKSR